MAGVPEYYARERFPASGFQPRTKAFSFPGQEFALSGINAGRRPVNRRTDRA